MLTLIENAEIHAPQPRGRGSILLMNGHIGVVGEVDRDAALRIDPDCHVIDASGCIATPSSVTGSIRNDMLFIEEVVGAGEVAIADHRGLCPQVPELAKLVLDTHVGGMLSGKSGVTHFHVGEHEQRLKRLRELLDGDFAVAPDMLYPTHIARSEALMEEAIALAARGAYVDIDTADDELARWIRFYLDHGGDPKRLTVSSDSGASSPFRFYEQLCHAVVHERIPLETVLPLVTSNTASVLKLRTKGRLEPGCDGDILIMDARSLEIRHVIAAGAHMVRDGALARQEHFLATTTRSIHLEGTKAS